MALQRWLWKRADLSWFCSCARLITGSNDNATVTETDTASHPARLISSEQGYVSIPGNQQVQRYTS
jgi:hypothetical protein